MDVNKLAISCFSFIAACYIADLQSQHAHKLIKYSTVMHQKRQISHSLKPSVTPKFADDIPSHIREDINAISQRTGVSIINEVIANTHFSVSNSYWRSKHTGRLEWGGTMLSIKPEAWTKSRFRDVLPSLSHELAHISLHILPHVLKTRTPSQMHKEELAADAHFALKTGTAKDDALELWRSNDIKCLTHPASMLRANRLYQLHRENINNPYYLDGRFWKLGFVLQSYRNQMIHCQNFCGAFPEHCITSNGYWCARLASKSDKTIKRKGTVHLLTEIIRKNLSVTKHLEADMDKIEENGFEEANFTNDIILALMPTYDFILFSRELNACSKILEKMKNAKSGNYPTEESL